MQREEIEAFLAKQQVALVGVSRNNATFGNKVYEKLVASGKQVQPVHPEMQSMGNTECVRTVRDLPQETQALMLVAGPDVCARVLQDVAGTSIRSIWVFPAARSRSDIDAGIERLQAAGVSVISGQCPFMFLEPVDSVHAVHRFFVRLMGKYPK